MKQSKDKENTIFILLKTELKYNGNKYLIDLSQPIDLSIPYVSQSNTSAFGAQEAIFTPYQEGDFIGSIAQGSPVNFYDCKINPHANGTHTECLGHITKEPYFINQQLNEFHLIATLISITPEAISDDDFIITKPLLQEKLLNQDCFTTLIIRTIPNSNDKLNKNYTGTNPPYFTPEAMEYIVAKGIEHLLIDLPSVDKEKDDGLVVAHKIFWQTETAQPRLHATITELIYVPDEVQDGMYFLNLQVAAFQLDAAPSRPLIYKIENHE